MKKFPFYEQIDRRDCGPTCLRMIARYYGKFFSREYLREKTYITKQGVSLAGIAEGAEEIGFRTLGLSVDIDTLVKDIPLPCIVPWRQRHFIVVYKTTKKSVFVADPAFGIIKYSIEEFKKGWFNEKPIASNFVLALEPSPNFHDLEKGSKEKKGTLSFLLPYFSPYKKILFQVCLGLIIGTTIQLILPFLMQSIVDYGVNFKNLNFIYIILIGQLTLFLSSIFLRVFRDWLILHMTSRLGIRMVSDYLIKILRLPINFYETRATGEHMQRIQDHSRVQKFLSATTLNTIFSVFTLIAFSAILAYYNITIFLIFLVGSLIFIGWTFFFLKRRALLDFKRFDQLSDNQSSLIEIIDGIYEIKVNNSHRKKRWNWEGIQIKLFKLSIKSLALSQSQNIGANVINEIKNIVITFISAKAVIDGNMTLGMMISVQYIIGQLNVPLNNFIGFIQAGQDAKISLERLSQIHNKEEENSADETVDLVISDTDININNLSFRYGGKSSPLVLKDINITIPTGKTTAIVGASGSGKTTLLKLLLKFYKPTIGNIKINNTLLSLVHSNKWRERCGAVLQDGYIFNDSIAGNIAESEQSGVIDKRKIIEAVRISNIEEHINTLPNGYNTLIGRRGISLSGGERQRIFIARAIYKNPQFLFFDEATSALDANNEKVVMNRLNEFLKSKTAVIIAHRLSTVKNADKIIVLEKGKVVEEGTHEKLTEIKGKYYELVKNQLELGN